MNELVTCTKCNWVSYALTRADAQTEIDQFNAYFESLSKEKQDLYYGGKKSRLENYRCNCGGSTFRPYTSGDCPDGCTINPVIWEG